MSPDSVISGFSLSTQASAHDDIFDGPGLPDYVIYRFFLSAQALAHDEIFDGPGFSLSILYSKFKYRKTCMQRQCLC